MNNTQTLIGRHPEICFTQINNEEIVVLDHVNEQFYYLNETAVDLWLSLETPKTVLELSEVLSIRPFNREVQQRL